MFDAYVICLAIGRVLCVVCGLGTVGDCMSGVWCTCLSCWFDVFRHSSGDSHGGFYIRNAAGNYCVCFWCRCRSFESTVVFVFKMDVDGP